MTMLTLVRRSLLYYWRTNLAVLFGVATAVAVLGGALLVGDSVRGSLRDLALSRLGRVDQAIAAPHFFREALAESLIADPDGAVAFASAAPIVALEGMATAERSGLRAGRVQVYGVDARFWAFHGVAPGPTGSEAADAAYASAALARELDARPGDTLLVRVEKPSEIPGESLHGRREDVGRTMRVELTAALDRGALGEFALRPRQGDVRAVFVPLGRLQRDLDQPGKVNTVLLAQRTPTASADDPAAIEAAAAAARALRRAATLDDLGVRVTTLADAGVVVVESDAGLLDDIVAAAAHRAASEAGLPAQNVLTYLANTIRAGEREIPYSLVAGLDGSLAASGLAFNRDDAIVLNAWAARELGARPGDDVWLEYFLWDGSRLRTDRARFTLTGVVPIAGIAADRRLAPDYPGITETDSLADWDPPFPIDLTRVRPADEDYWDRYRTTPKAFVPLPRAQALWQSRFGGLTSIRLRPPAGQSVDAAATEYAQQLSADLDPIAAGFQIAAARAQALAASGGATDFGEYFVYFSFFLVVSGLLLTVLFFKLGIEQRAREVGLLRATGFHHGLVRRLFLLEGLTLSAAAGAVGVAAAVGYAWLIMLALRTWWIGAVGTTLLALHVTPWSLVTGGAGGVAASALCILWTLRALAGLSPRRLMQGQLLPETGAGAGRARGMRAWSGAFAAAGLALVALALAGAIDQAAAFFGAGLALLVASLVWMAGWLRRRDASVLGGHGWWSVARLGMRSATYRPARSVLCIALVAFAAFIIVSVDAFRRRGGEAGGPRSGTGGYAFVAESLLPVFHDPGTPEGREALGIDRDAALHGAAFARFRLRPGDDASCLNLYRPGSPRVLGASDAFLRSGRFAFASSLAATEAERANPWLLLERDLEEGVVPAIADATSIKYVLHRAVGDEIVIDEASARPIRLRLVAALDDSVLQGELIVAERQFVRLFPDEEGYRYFLIEAAEPDFRLKAEATSQGGATSQGEATSQGDATGADLAARLESRLRDYGFDATSAPERLQAFHRVENTYLSTFQALGALGLALGTIGLAAVMVRNVLERRRELALLRAVGYDGRDLSLLIAAETVLLLGFGLAAGAGCAALAIVPTIAARGGAPGLALAGLLAAVAAAGLLSSAVAVRAARGAPLVATLRAE